MSFGDWLKRVFSRKDTQSNMVRFYDTERERVVEIPASELAPGVIQVHHQGIEGVVWIEADKLHQGNLKHPPLSEDMREYIRRIQNAFKEHRDLSLEEWEEGFRRDTNAAKEIACWCHAADVYLEFAESESSSDRRRAIYECVVACLIASPDTVRHVLRPSRLSREEIARIVGKFFVK